MINNNADRPVSICPKAKLYLLERPANIQWAEIKPLAGDAGFTRNIDKKIHIDYWKNIRPLLNSQPKNAYFKEQQKLIKLVSGCEKAIFNDPTTNYPFRDTFCGVTGTTTNIITGGFFHLYLHALKVPGIKVNVCTDLVTMFDHLTKYAQYNNGFHMDDVELEAIKEIISILMDRKKTLPHMKDLFTNQWFDAYEKLIKDTHKQLISMGDDTFYWEKPTFSNVRRGRGFESSLRALFPPECALKWRGDSIIGDYPDRPRYLRRDPSWGPVPEVFTGRKPEISDEAVSFLNELKGMFVSDALAGGRRKTHRSRKRRAAKTRKYRS
jgi:hypothetical protein